ncbi:hypothetical protein SISSUDRAFT_310599 [Sistotremastrum suecicum HHB10207 ss-3]|uniref:Uncharacterized protein n=1 Tax=Sistotremastrum suecicum HHB10207 ss-3 TaxID=1314776 RepID=A0A165ZC85_9AGAM|nr:hypothetical protein SISSUDRAFT_310599 [Sistotremastrum suecicum HHB10207 ss-3]
MPLEGHPSECQGDDTCPQSLPEQVTAFVVPSEILYAYLNINVSDSKSFKQKAVVTRKGYETSAANLLKIYKRCVLGLVAPNDKIPKINMMHNAVPEALRYLRDKTDLCVEKQFMWETGTYLVYVEPKYKTPIGRYLPVPDPATWQTMLVEKLPILVNELGLEWNPTLTSYEVRPGYSDRSAVVEGAILLQLCPSEGFFEDTKDSIAGMLSSALEVPLNQDPDDEDEDEDEEDV